MLNEHQRKYSVTEKECLAIVLAVKQFHVYLLGFFIVRTDHRALVWLHRMKDTSSKLLRWAMFLQEYQFLIVYGKGEANVVADALSRLKVTPALPVDENHEFNPVDLDSQPPVSFIQSLVTCRNVTQTKFVGSRDEIGLVDKSKYLAPGFAITRTMQKSCTPWRSYHHSWKA